MNTGDKFVWIYGAFELTSWVVGALLFITFRKLDVQEVELNAIGTGEREAFKGEHREVDGSVS